VEIRYFRSFVEVAARGHVGRAAEALNIAQPSLSYQIARLEEDFGTPLFVRGPRGVDLTAAGSALLDEVGPLLRRVDGLGEHVRAAAGGRIGTLKIGLVSGAVLSGVATRVVRAYRARFPKVMLRVSAVLHVPLVRMLREGEVDLAVFGSSLGDPTLVGDPLARETFVVALPSDHRLASKKSVRYRDLAGEALVALTRAAAPSLFDSVLTTCGKNGFDPTVVEEAYGEDAVMGLVAAGAGVAIVPNSWAAIAIPGVVTRKLSPAGAGATLRLFRRAGDASPLVRSFVECALGVRTAG
jgi:DNA-binding transcriptional LysR family regulator